VPNRTWKIFIGAMVATAVLLISPAVFSTEAAVEGKPDLFLGKRTSKAEVYIVTDWLCPSCREIEPELAKRLPKITSRAKVIFVDFPIHPESANFTPYHLSLLVHEKKRYLQARDALFKLARRTITPSVADVQQAVSPLGIRLKLLSFVEVVEGMHYFEAFIKTYHVNMTPTVVVRNSVTNEVRYLLGELEISGAAILGAVKNLSGDS